ncbi:hypothetical protein FVF61_08830 [Formosa maritima]|uniref:Uncharacterized protein n=2 Tax=Formosa maritima TaxID=2592046 RepID=A0A5D0G920_9FLAO|nr:DUF6090 family protein [Formosa maritima]TYA54312.1 hypothetical protein FVF61_08830 [Formosa maritima]
MVKNKTGKYFKYAIGEIILVVIGILIALSINNWNESRKAHDKTELLLKQVHKELAFNIDKANNVIERYRQTDTLIYNVLHKKVTYHDYKSNLKYVTLMRGTTEANLVNDAFTTLIDNQGIINLEQDSIIEKLRYLYGTDKREVDLMDAYTVNNVINKIKKLGTNGWLYDNHVNKEASDEQITYYLTDSSYLGEVTEYKIRHLLDHNRYALIFRNHAIDIYNALSDYLKIKKDTSIVKDLKDYQHYLGTYVSDNETVNSEITIKNNHLVMLWKHIKDTTRFGERKLYPETKTNFTFPTKAFGKLVYDENKEVSGFIWSVGNERQAFKKIK